MFDIHTVEIEWGGRKLRLETGRMARQADAAVVAQYGETSVLATVVAIWTVLAPAAADAEFQLSIYSGANTANDSEVTISSPTLSGEFDVDWFGTRSTIRLTTACEGPTG